MSMSQRPLGFWCALGALTMSLGWGLRGSIGGGSLGAMIPGAMIALVLCRLLGRERDAGVITALGAIGVGFGGQETYGQTVGLSLRPETFWWAILGFTIKGAAWGLLGGAFLGVAFDRRRLSTRRILVALALMIAGAWVGWKLVNEPKLIYFSNRIDRPRQELWAGLWLGGLLLLAWLRARIPWLFALYGAAGGGIGFGFGASLQPWGRDVWALMPLGWWKAMELTFGALLGLSYILCGWRLRDELAGDGRTETPATPLPRAGLFAAVAIALAVGAGENLPLRFGFTVSGAVLAALALAATPLAWQTAITATAAAYSIDALKALKLLSSIPGWIVVTAVTVAVCAAVARRAGAFAMLRLLIWTALASALRYLLQPGPRVSSITMLLVFLAMAAAIDWMARRAAAGRT
jgi:hypothetical protein